MANKKGMSPVGAGVVGAVVGAAAGATAVALSDPENRKKIVNEFNVIKKEGQKVYAEMEKKAEDTASVGEEKVEEAKQAVKSKL